MSHLCPGFHPRRRLDWLNVTDVAGRADMVGWLSLTWREGLT
jgi:hypothetical protein